MTRKKKPAASLVRSSAAAEYLTIDSASRTGGVKTVHANENVGSARR
jgi:hypothetical protein